ncbi:hypothetical protein [Pedobacter sp. ASV12]|uniref:hypothetical protein n=1 Tax=Pedobacter sp. ASV12 TaxID=2795120 RepID=UPI0018ED387B|nr:hypothetical protein [Pedobacter sp. ASV12]
MKNLTLLSKAELKKVTGGGCPAWAQAKCLQEAASLEPTGDANADVIQMDVYYDLCIKYYDENPA